MTNALTTIKRMIRPLIPVGYFEYVNRRQYLRSSIIGRQAQDGGGKIEAPGATSIAEYKRCKALVLHWSHEYGAVEAFSHAVGESLSLLQFEVTVVNTENKSDLERIAESGEQFDIAIAIGALPLAATAQGRAIFEVFGDIFFFYGLDSIINDLARIGAVQSYWEAAHRSSRLRFLCPDRGYCRIIGSSLASHQVIYLPFGGFYDPLPPPGREEHRMPRLAIVGTIGAELTDFSEGDLGAIIDADRTMSLSRSQRDNMIAAIQVPNGPTNVTAVARSVLGVEPQRLLSNEYLPLLAKIDSFEKRRRRLLLVERLRGLPVDFYGSGWEKYVEPGETFRFAGQVHFLAISRLSRCYSCVVNFDPNWDDGLHDRVYTALGNGCRVLTNVSTALADIETPAGSVQTYDPNNPDVAEAVKAILAAPAVAMADVMRFRKDNGWLARVDALSTQIM